MSGRHRQENPRRHRARRTPRARTVALGTALGAALLAGVASGTAAPAAEHRTPTVAPAAEHRASAARGAPAATAAAEHQEPIAVPADLPAVVAARPATAGSTLAERGRAPAKWQPPAPPPISRVTGRIAAAPVRHKPRPTVIRNTAGAAWVNPNPTATVTSCFGPRWGRLHEGVDLAAPDGSAIVAAGAGVVLRAGAENGYGNAVLIDHGDGYLTHYGHLSAITVAAGQRVTAGEQIGNEGSTGHSTGPHLHFEVHQGYYQNPVEPTLWMHEHGVEITGCGTF